MPNLNVEGQPNEPSKNEPKYPEELLEKIRAIATDMVKAMNVPPEMVGLKEPEEDEPMGSNTPGVFHTTTDELQKSEQSQKIIRRGNTITIRGETYEQESSFPPCSVELSPGSSLVLNNTVNIGGTTINVDIDMSTHHTEVHQTTNHRTTNTSVGVGDSVLESMGKAFGKLFGN